VDLLRPTEANALARLAYANLLLAGFNLLPAFPMDGGRILRALLSFIRPEDQATRMAGVDGPDAGHQHGPLRSSRAAVMLVFLRVLHLPGRRAGKRSGHGTHAHARHSGARRDDHAVPHSGSRHTIRDAANLLLSTSQQDFPVIHGDQVVGMLGRNLLLKSLAAEGPEAYVAGVMDRDFLFHFSGG